MRTAALCLLLRCLPPEAALAQESDHFKFDVASVKLAAPDDDAPSYMRGGPGTSDPELITYQRQPLSRLLAVAYGLDFDQISGPGWIGTDLYSIVARIPPGTTKEQLRLMWKDLLLQRFHLKTHFTQKDFPVYDLSVGKGGPKFRQEPGFPVPPAGEKWALLPSPRHIRMTCRDCSMVDFAERLGWPLSTIGGSGGLAMGRVFDKTGLDGLYSFTFEFAGRWGPGGAFLPPLPDGQADTAPTLFAALRQQLNLKLEEKKAPLNVLVVDHVDRIPAEN